MSKHPIRDTSEVYGTMTRHLHWFMAALIIWQFFGMGVKLILGRGEVSGFFVGLHGPTGLVIFLFVIWRLIWAWKNRKNRPSHGAGLMGQAARLGHKALYAFMLAVPVIGLIRAWGSERAFAPFGLPLFPAREVEIAWTKTLGDALHGELAWIWGVVILGHIGMVFVHKHIFKDDTAKRMMAR